MIISAQITSVGGRSRNEDTVWTEWSPEGFLGIVADGLGGHGGGQIASREAAASFAEDYLQKRLLTREQFETAFEKAGKRVEKKQSPQCSMKTTSVILTVENRTARWAHTGDSRLYHFFENRLVSQTMDHSVSQMAVLMGEITPDQIRFHEDRNRVLRALGSENWEPTIAPAIPVDDGFHAFLLCTDGFWEYVYEKEMEETLRYAANPDEWLGRMEKLLLGRVKANNDNYTALAVFIKAEEVWK